MLIDSPRHRSEDLEFWADLEQADLIHAESPRLSRLVERSQSAIQQFHDAGRCYCGVSWGKDSVVVAHLICSMGLGTPEGIPLCNLRVTPSRNPDCDAVRDAFRSLFPAYTYYEFAVDYSGLNRRKLTPVEWDAETDRLWSAGWNAVRKITGTDRHISGVRANESAVRKLRCMRWGENTANTCAPLAWWTDKDVFAYLAINNLPVHPAYAMLGGGRWPRERLRTAEIGDTHGTGGGRREWESEFYGDILRRIEAHT